MAEVHTFMLTASHGNAEHRTTYKAQVRSRGGNGLRTARSTYYAIEDQYETKRLEAFGGWAIRGSWLGLRGASAACSALNPSSDCPQRIHTHMTSCKYDSASYIAALEGWRACCALAVECLKPQIAEVLQLPIQSHVKVSRPIWQRTHIE